MLQVQFDVDKVQNHAPGWEDEWGRIIAHLIGNCNAVPSPDEMDDDDMDDEGEGDENTDVDNDGGDDYKEDNESKNLTCMVDPLENNFKNSAFYKCCYTIINRKYSYKAKEQRYQLLEEFSSYVLTVYQERVNTQTLFTDYDPKRGNAIQYLCSRTRLRFFFHDFENNSTRSRFLSLFEPVGGDGERNTELISTIPSSEKTAEEKYCHAFRQKEVQTLLNSFDSIVVICPRKGTHMYEQTGLQLYPRLHVKNDEMISLRQCSCDVVKDALHISCDDADSMIRERHISLATVYLNKIMDLRDQLNTSERMEQLTRARKTNKIDSLYRQLYLSPLEAKDISELCKVSMELAYAYRSRYIKEIPAIIANSIAKYNSLG